MSVEQMMDSISQTSYQLWRQFYEQKARESEDESDSTEFFE